MADTIRLKHMNLTNMPLRMQYFYDGRAEVRYGIIELPTSKPAWIDRAFILGFRRDPDSGRLLELVEIRAMAQSTKSAGETDEGTDGGGQPAGEDGVRESEPESDGGISVAGVDSSVSDGPKPRTTRRRTK